MLKSVCVLFSVLFIAPLASAEIFKCVAKNGLDLYQNFPCQFESMGWTPMDAQGPKTPLAPSDSNQAKPKAVALEAAASGKSPAVPGELRIGMTTEEVRAIWGEPTDTVQEEPGDAARFEIWSYGTSRSVRFDRKGRVSAIQHRA